MKHNLAIAYAVKRRAQKMAKGGMLTHDGYESECTEHCEAPCEVHPQASGYEMHKEDDVKRSPMAMHEDHKMLGQHGEKEKGPEGVRMAQGGVMKPMHGEETQAHEDDMVGRVMKKRQCMSKGGEVANDTEPFEADFETPNEFDDLVLDDHLESHGTDNEIGDKYGADHDDMIARVMMKRKKQQNPSPE